MYLKDTSYQELTNIVGMGINLSMSTWWSVACQQRSSKLGWMNDWKILLKKKKLKLPILHVLHKKDQ